MEPTLLNNFIRNARLRQWLSRPDLPIALKACAKMFERFFGGTSPYLVDVESGVIDEEGDAADADLGGHTSNESVCT